MAARKGTTMDFSRDFGYLDKFLVNVAQAAEALPPAQAARLKQLMAEETARWAEVKRLLAGEAPSAPVASTSAAGVPSQPAAAPAPGPAGAAPVGLTVGSLMGQARK